jgi:pimeloyl-ACP methyl ester carboxylesterase
MTTKTVLGTTLNYEDHGVGDVLFFIHGYCMNLHLWDAQAAEMSTTHRVIAVDMPGHGQSEPLEPGFSFEDVGHLMLTFLDDLGVQEFHVAGMSQGGFTALRMVLEAPARVRSLALVASAPRGKVNEAFAGMVEGFRQGQRDAIIPMVVTLQMEPGTAESDPDLVKCQIATIQDELSDESLIAFGEAVLNQTDVSPRLSDIAIPVLLIHGDADTGISVDEAREAEPLFPNARLVEIPGGGHNINIQSAEQVSAVLREFYQRF